MYVFGYMMDLDLWDIRQIQIFGLFRKDKSCIVTKFHRTDSVICCHSREGKTPVL